jgi:arsenical pump membrane protein
VALRGSFIERIAMGSILAAAVNNLPAAASTHTVSGAGRWAAILGSAIGPNLLVWGSVATLICRRIARQEGSCLRGGSFVSLGVVLVPLQLAAASAGLWLTGALR